MTASEPRSDPHDAARVVPSSTAPVGDRDLPAYVAQQLAFYTRTTRSSRIGYYILELLAIGLAAAVPVATATGTVPGVIAALGSAATAVGAARHIFGFDRNWTARAVTAERIKGRAVLFTLGLIDAPRLVTDVTELVDRETAGWSHAVRAALGTSAGPDTVRALPAAEQTPGDGDA